MNEEEDLQKMNFGQPLFSDSDVQKPSGLRYSCTVFWARLQFRIKFYELKEFAIYFY